MSVYLSSSSVLLDSGSVATSEDCCCSCDCPEGQMKLKIDVTWTATLDYTGDDCENHFTDSGSYTSTFCAAPDAWRDDYEKDYDECPDRSGMCARVALTSPDREDYLDASSVQIGVSGLLCSCVGIVVGINIVCRYKNVADCIVAELVRCRAVGGSFMSEPIADINHPEGTYTFSDSHSETDFSWSWDATAVVTLICTN